MSSEEDADDISSHGENDGDAPWQLSEEDISSSSDDEDDSSIENKQIVSKLVREIISGKPYDPNSNLLKNCSYSILMYNKNTKELTPNQFEEMVMEKAALAIVNNSDLGNQLFEAKNIDKEQQLCISKFENLKKQTASMRGIIKNEKRKPFKKELSVRSVGTQFNFYNTDENNV